MKDTSSKGFVRGTIKIRISPKSTAITNGELSPLKEFHKVQLDADI
jgi:hypothetical protein